LPYDSSAQRAEAAGTQSQIADLTGKRIIKHLKMDGERDA
jgi:uncharacterized protein YihD (DUF1040 family)